jgi:hypothetical protein
MCKSWKVKITVSGLGIVLSALFIYGYFHLGYIWYQWDTDVSHLVPRWFKGLVLIWVLAIIFFIGGRVMTEESKPRVVSLGDTGVFLCHCCKVNKSATFSDVYLPHVHRRVIVGICDSCDSVITIPEQSNPDIIEYLSCKIKTGI